MRPFEVVLPFKPAGDQKEAVAALAKGIKAGDQYQTLLIWYIIYNWGEKIGNQEIY
jgi:excinuclease UvrABC helicase subunit UvrB